MSTLQSAKPVLALLALSIFAVASVQAQSSTGSRSSEIDSEGPFTDLYGEPTSESLATFSPDVRIFVGKATSSEGDHGGTQLGILVGGEYLGWTAGFQATGMGEGSKLFGIDPIQPRESYRFQGLFGGRIFRNERARLTLGMGAGRLKGTRRGALLSVEEECRTYHMFGGCSEDEVIEVRTYAREEFSALSLNPMLSLDAQLSRHFAVGLVGQTFLNPTQSLSSVAVVLRLGQ